jgi:hypothetical protein
VRLTADDVAVFDLGGVVARFQPELRLHRLAQVTQLTEHDVSVRLFDSGLDHRAELGAFGADEIVDVLLDDDMRNVESARECGWGAVHVDESKRFGG